MMEGWTGVSLKNIFSKAKWPAGYTAGLFACAPLFLASYFLASPTRADYLPASVSRYNFPMRHSFEEVQQIARELPVNQRILLANSLWESAEAGEEATEAEIAAVWEPEIARRVEEIKSGIAVTCSLAEVEADLRAVLGA